MSGEELTREHGDAVICEREHGRMGEELTRRRGDTGKRRKSVVIASDLTEVGAKRSQQAETATVAKRLA